MENVTSIPKGSTVAAKIGAIHMYDAVYDYFAWINAAEEDSGMARILMRFKLGLESGLWMQ